MNTTNNANPYRSKDFPHELFGIMCSNNELIHLSNVEELLRKDKEAEHFYVWFWPNGDYPTALMKRSEWANYVSDNTIPKDVCTFTGNSFGYFLPINRQDGVHFFCEKPDKMRKQKIESSANTNFFGRIYESFTVIANVQESGEITAIAPIFNNKKDLDRFVDDVQQYYEDWQSKQEQEDWYYPAGNYLQISITAAQWLYENNPEKID